MAKDLFNKIMGKVPVPADKTAEAEVEVKQEKQENVAKKAAVEKTAAKQETADEAVAAEELEATGEETAETEPKAAAEKKPKESEFIIETGRSNAYMIQNNKKNRLIEKIKGEIHFNMEKEDESEAVTEADKAFKTES